MTAQQKLNYTITKLYEIERRLTDIEKIQKENEYVRKYVDGLVAQQLTPEGLRKIGDQVDRIRQERVNQEVGMREAGATQGASYELPAPNVEFLAQDYAIARELSRRIDSLETIDRIPNGSLIINSNSLYKKYPNGLSGSKSTVNFKRTNGVATSMEWNVGVENMSIIFSFIDSQYEEAYVPVSQYIIVYDVVSKIGWAYSGYNWTIETDPTTVTYVKHPAYKSSNFDVDTWLSDLPFGIRASWVPYTVDELENGSFGQLLKYYGTIDYLAALSQSQLQRLTDLEDVAGTLGVTSASGITALSLVHDLSARSVRAVEVSYTLEASSRGYVPHYNQIRWVQNTLTNDDWAVTVYPSRNLYLNRHLSLAAMWTVTSDAVVRGDFIFLPNMLMVPTNLPVKSVAGQLVVGGNTWDYGQCKLVRTDDDGNKTSFDGYISVLYDGDVTQVIDEPVTEVIINGVTLQPSEWKLLYQPPTVISEETLIGLSYVDAKTVWLAVDSAVQLDNAKIEFRTSVVLELDIKKTFRVDVPVSDVLASDVSFSIDCDIEMFGEMIEALTFRFGNWEGPNGVYNGYKAEYISNPVVTETEFAGYIEFDVLADMDDRLAIFGIPPSVDAWRIDCKQKTDSRDVYIWENDEIAVAAYTNESSGARPISTADDDIQHTATGGVRTLGKWWFRRPADVAPQLGIASDALGTITIINLDRPNIHGKQDKFVQWMNGSQFLDLSRQQHGSDYNTMTVHAIALERHTTGGTGYYANKSVTDMQLVTEHLTRINYTVGKMGIDANDTSIVTLQARMQDILTGVAMIMNDFEIPETDECTINQLGVSEDVNELRLPLGINSLSNLPETLSQFINGMTLFMESYQQLLERVQVLEQRVEMIETVVNNLITTVNNLIAQSAVETNVWSVFGELFQLIGGAIAPFLPIVGTTILVVGTILEGVGECQEGDFISGVINILVGIVIASYDGYKLINRLKTKYQFKGVSLDRIAEKINIDPLQGLLKRGTKSRRTESGGAPVSYGSNLWLEDELLEVGMYATFPGAANVANTQYPMVQYNKGLTYDTSNGTLDQISDTDYWLILTGNFIDTLVPEKLDRSQFRDRLNITVDAPQMEDFILVSCAAAFKSQPVAIGTDPQVDMILRMVPSNVKLSNQARRFRLDTRDEQSYEANLVFDARFGPAVTSWTMNQMEQSSMARGFSVLGAKLSDVYEPGVLATH